MITLKSTEHLQKMRVAGCIASSTLSYLKPLIVPGISAKQIDKLAEIFIRDNGGTPSCIGYKDYPAATCISINEQAVHCIPSETKIVKSGDIVKVDLVVGVDGFHADTARSFIIPPVSYEATTFIQTSYESLWLAIDKAIEGNFVSDLSNTIYDHITSKGYGVTKEFCGHGIGRNLHEEPQIPNYRLKDKGPMLIDGMVICIEPIILQKKDAKLIIEGWNTWVSEGLVAHFEHTVLIKGDKPEILTLREEEKINIS